MTYGIDVSDNNKGLSFAAVKSAGYSFCFVKTTQGKSFVSPTALGQIKSSLDVGLDTYAYHFADNTADANAQAANFIRNTTASITTVALDVEPPFSTNLNSAELISFITAWFISVRKQRPNLNLYLYIDKSDLSRVGNWSPLVSLGVKLWLPNPSRTGYPSTAFGTPAIQQLGTTKIGGVTVDTNEMIETEENTVTLPDTTKTYKVSDYRKKDAKGNPTVETYDQDTLLIQIFNMLSLLVSRK